MSAAEQLKADEVKAVAELLDAVEAVAFLGNKISKWSLYELVKRGEIPHVKICRRIYFRASTLIAWLSEKEAASIHRESKAAKFEG